jgi:hypothetical protein
VGDPVLKQDGFASSVLTWVSDDAPDCTTVDCFWGFYSFETSYGRRISPEGYLPQQPGPAGRAALRDNIVEPGDYLAMGDGTKGSHSGLFLAYNESHDRVWHIGGNESGDKVCRPDMHECGTAAVFIGRKATDEHEDEDYYHNMVGLNWCMERR